MPKVLEWLVLYKISILDSSSRRHSSSVCLYRYYIKSIIIYPISSGSVDIGRYGCTNANWPRKVFGEPKSKLERD